MIFKAYDIRGIYPSEINEEIVTKIAHYFTQKYEINNLVLAHDVRLSSPSLAQAFLEGVSKATVEYRNILPTPMLYFFAKFKDAGVIVTASHNPPNYNGLKIVYQGKSLKSRDIRDLENALKEDVKDKKREKEVKEVNEKESVKEYVDFIKENIEIGKAKLAIDFSNGSMAAIEATFFHYFPLWKVKKFNHIADGKFPAHLPDPSKPSNLAALSNYCLRNNTIGFGFDGDGDRLGVIDEKGNHISGDKILALLALHEKMKGKKVRVITEVNVSKGVVEFLDTYDIKVDITRVGHTFIEKKMYEGYNIGGELSGHYYFSINENVYEDAILAMFKLVEFLNKLGKKLHEWIEQFPSYYSTPALRKPVKLWRHQEEIIKHFQENYASIFPEYKKVIDVDGVRVEMEDAWFIIRKSNTEPVVALRIEAKEKRKIDEIKARINKEVKKWSIRF